jgi:hypothetical protein
MTHLIDIVISPMGEITIKTHGINGSACLDELEALSEALNAPALDSEFTEEFFGTVSTASNFVASQEGAVNGAT